MKGLSYFLITRKLFDSPIWRDDPHILKLFLYLIGMARHNSKPKRFNGFEINRGELVTSLSDISENNEYTERGRIKKWSRQRVSRMLKKLSDNKYISLLADTYGTHIKVINYDVYQDPKAYKRTTALRVRYGCVTGAYIYNKDNNVNNDKKKDIPFEIYNFYKTEINPSRKSSQRAKRNIKYYLKKYSQDDLKMSVINYKKVCGDNPEYKKDPANFFGKNDQYFLDYLPENFKLPKDTETPDPPQESLEELCS